MITDDAINSFNYPADQTGNNYIYDLTGDLIKDVAEGLDKIFWNNMGKVDSIFSSGKMMAMKFRYDPMGNRIEKIYHKLGAGNVITNSTSTHYVRDASGNTMAVYEFSNYDTLVLKELILYGSARLGTLKESDTLASASASITTIPSAWQKTVGDKQYELTNHLGNVMTTISDKPIGVDTTGDNVNDYYNPEIVTLQDYYLGGAVMPGRNFNIGDYRFGMMGYEKDNEISGNGNAYDFDGYGYDPRLNRRKGPDPMSKKYPDESPYSFAGNSPISLRDEDGKEKTYYMTRIANDGTTTQLKVVEKYTVQKQTTYTRESIGLKGITFFTSPVISNTKTFDVAQHITLDERTGKINVGKEYTTTERSNVAMVRGIEDNTRQLGNYLDEAANGGGGIVFTSGIGQGQETRKGYNADAQSENIDLLTSVIDASSAAAASKQAIGFLESFKQGVDAIGILKDVKDNTIGSSDNIGLPKSDSTYCGTCKQNVPNTDTTNHVLKPDKK